MVLLSRKIELYGQSGAPIGGVTFVYVASQRVISFIVKLSLIWKPLLYTNKTHLTHMTGDKLQLSTDPSK